ncbi:MAG: DUF2971 domain-containing protein [Candidatus Acidiferrales bacterium]|jgi:DUF2971 family protein
MQPWKYPVPPILYKFLSPKRFHVLPECRVRFSQRTAFDDEHELRPEYEIFGTGIEIWRYATSVGFPLGIPTLGIPGDVHAQYLADSPRFQETALTNLKIPVIDELGVFCLTETSDCDQMWMEYADKRTGFVIGFATTHGGFQLLKGRGSLGKVSYSDEPFGSALAGVLDNSGAEAMFRKRMKYAYENEWRAIRLLARLERGADDVFFSPFDPASISEIIIQQDCVVKTELRRLLSADSRYQHVKMRTK